MTLSLAELQTQFTVSLSGTTDQKLQTLANAVNDAESKLARLDDVLATDTYLSSLFFESVLLISRLNAASTNTITALNTIIASLNNSSIVYSKKISITDASGIYSFLYADNSISSGNYFVSAVPFGNNSFSATITNQTTSGFHIEIKSQGVHFVPQPVNCGSGNTVIVVLTITKDRETLDAVAYLDSIWDGLLLFNGEKEWLGYLPAHFDWDNTETWESNKTWSF